VLSEATVLAPSGLSTGEKRTGGTLVPSNRTLAGAQVNGHTLVETQTIA